MEIGTFVTWGMLLIQFYTYIVVPGRWGTFAAKLLVCLALTTVPIGLIEYGRLKERDWDIAMSFGIVTMMSGIMFVTTINWLAPWSHLRNQAMFAIIMHIAMTVGILYEVFDGPKLRHVPFVVIKVPKIMLKLWLRIPREAGPFIYDTFREWQLSTRVGSLVDEPLTIPAVLPNGDMMQFTVN